MLCNISVIKFKLPKPLLPIVCISHSSRNPSILSDWIRTILLSPRTQGLTEGINVTWPFTLFQLDPLLPLMRLKDVTVSAKPRLPLPLFKRIIPLQILCVHKDFEVLSVCENLWQFAKRIGKPRVMKYIKNTEARVSYFGLLIFPMKLD